MKILIINFEYPPLGGGGGVATKDFGEELARQHEVHVITTWFKGLKRYECVAGVHIHRVRVVGRQSLPTSTLTSMITFVPAAVMTGIRLCRQNAFEVINAQFVLPSGVPAVVLAKMFRLPLVVSFIGGDIYDPSKGVSPHRHWLLRSLIRFISRQAIAGTAISHDTKRRAETLHGVSLPITVTPLGLRPVSVAPTSRAALGLSDNSFLFITIGRLIPRKGYEMLLSAWQDIPESLAIIGSGPLKKPLQELIKKYQLANRVRILGYVEESTKNQMLRVADAYISASNHEGFGIVFLEAMAAGLPIIALNDGGHTDFLTADENALLIPPQNPTALQQAVRQLVADHKLQER
ncbi:MAG: glycosyltransferase, partial [Candidatus Andersenbacteria bacterium]